MGRLPPGWCRSLGDMGSALIRVVRLAAEFEPSMGDLDGGGVDAQEIFN